MAPKATPSRPAKHGYEFFGPPGAFGISVGLPLLTYAFAFTCNDISGCPAPSLLHPSTFQLEKLKREVGWEGFSSLLNTQAALGVAGWYLLSLTLYAFLPAKEMEGIELDSGGKLKYRFNALAFSSSVVTLALLAVGTLLQGTDFPVWTFVWDNYIPILTANLLISYGLATLVYIRSFSVKPGNPEHRELAKGGVSGNILYDWFIGRELNPRITLPIFGEVDIKCWCELRPGMLGWLVLDLANVAHQYKVHGRVSDSILLSTFAQGLYVLDSHYMEPAILTTIDIISDGFGLMLAFGDLVWVPFTYSLQTRYLAVYPVDLGPLGLLGVCSVQGLGYWMFRSVNNEKNRFRTNPNDPKVAHLKYIETKAGSKLLISGWWGTARHINYLGDWIMSWAYCLPTGLAGYVIQNGTVAPGEAKGWGMVVTYFYMIYFAVLLIHRERRDEEKCRRKYGEDWEKYCKIVPSRIIPGIY